MEQIIEVMLGTSARIGEVLAIRKCDVDVTVSPATVRIWRNDRVTRREADPSTASPEDREVHADGLGTLFHRGSLA